MFSKELDDPSWHVALRQHRGQLPLKEGRKCSRTEYTSRYLRTNP